MNPESQIFWYGDAFARRGFVVLALDVSHRDYASRSALYTDELDGDDPSNGNHSHPAIASSGFDSDWEEDGERVFDVMRAVDVLQATQGVDASRILSVGLSLGGEVAAYSAALDDRFAQAVVAGFSPDFGVVAHHLNHPCWQWQHADVREYVDSSDLFALIAPRPLVVETGILDSTFSSFSAPFASDKQVMRRAGAAGSATHFLHGGTHELRIGDAPAQRGISVPQAKRPVQRFSEDWQIDSTTTLLPETVFDLISRR
jgi:poly(3-hydroxybutyrate) depolymerase